MAFLPFVEGWSVFLIHENAVKKWLKLKMTQSIPKRKMDKVIPRENNVNRPIMATLSTYYVSEFIFIPFRTISWITWLFSPAVMNINTMKVFHHRLAPFDSSWPLSCGSFHWWVPIQIPANWRAFLFVVTNICHSFTLQTSYEPHRDLSCQINDFTIMCLFICSGYQFIRIKIYKTNWTLVQSWEL